MKDTKLKGNLMLLLTALVWGISFISQSIGVETLSPATFNGVRSVLGGITLLPVIFLMNRAKKKRSEPEKSGGVNLLIGGIICGVLLCLASTIQTAGMVYTSPGKAGFITALYMVIVPIIGLFMGKKLRAVLVAAVMIAVVGVYLLCMNESLVINKGDIMVFICAIIFSFHIMAIDYFSPKVDGVKLSCIQFFVCGILDLIWMFIFDSYNVTQILACWKAIAYSGIMSCGVAYTLQVVGQKYTDPTSASILMSLESVFAVLATVILVSLGWDLEGGMLTLREILGCVLMFGAILLVQLPEKQKVTEPTEKGILENEIVR